MNNVTRYLLGVITTAILLTVMTIVIQVSADKSRIETAPAQVDSTVSSTTTTTTATTCGTTSLPTTTTTSTSSTTSPTTRSVVSSVGRSYPVPFTQDLQDWVHELCEYYDFDDELIYQIIKVESNYNPESQNSICKGLMQVHTGYVDHYAQVEDNYSYVFKEGFDKTKDIFDPYKNILLGIRVLDEWRSYCEQEGYTSVMDWLCAYNAGWTYMDTHDTFYGEWVLSIDIYKLDFSTYEVIG